MRQSILLQPHGLAVTDIPFVSTNSNLKLMTGGTFIPWPKPLLNYTVITVDVELTRGRLCGKCLELILHLVLSLALFSVTKQHVCIHMT
jgi:hypothetical protein